MDGGSVGVGVGVGTGVSVAVGATVGAGVLVGAAVAVGATVAVGGGAAVGVGVGVGLEQAANTMAANRAAVSRKLRAIPDILRKTSQASNLIPPTGDFVERQPLCHKAGKTANRPYVLPRRSLGRVDNPLKRSARRICVIPSQPLNRHELVRFPT